MKMTIESGVLTKRVNPAELVATTITTMGLNEAEQQILRNHPNLPDQVGSLATAGLFGSDPSAIAEATSDAVDATIQFGASPSKIAEVLRNNPNLTMSDVHRLYQVRRHVPGTSISRLAHMTSIVGADIMTDEDGAVREDFLDSLNKLTGRIGAGLKAARKNGRGYVEPYDTKGRVEGIAFRIAVEKIEEADELGKTIYDLVDDLERGAEFPLTLHPYCTEEDDYSENSRL